jgi:hypothetical protein
MEGKEKQQVNKKIPHQIQKYFSENNIGLSKLFDLSLIHLFVGVFSYSRPFKKVKTTPGNEFKVFFIVPIQINNHFI